MVAPTRIRPSPSGRAIDLITYSSAAGALPTTLWVDQNTLVPLADQNGSVLAPYATLTAAIGHANAGASSAWLINCAFGDYRAEAPLQLAALKRFVFQGPFRSSVVMRLPQVLWVVRGPGTSYLHFRNVEAGLVTVLDGSPISTTTVIVYENSACLGINASTAAAAITVLMAGASLASFETSTNTFVLGVARENAVNLQNGTIFAQNIQFDVTCPLVRAVNVLVDGCSFAQNMQILGTTVELRDSRWVTGSAFTCSFMAGAGQAFLDNHTQHSFDIAAVSLVNGTVISTDQTYDTSSVIPIPEGSTTGQTTFGTLVTFVGASYRIPTYASATNIYIVATAVSDPTTLVLAFYQSLSGQTTPPIPRVGVASLLISAPGTFLVPLTALMRVVPGVLFALVGKLSGGGNITIRTYTTPTQELLNDASVPSSVYPTAFTTTIGVTASPPSTLNPTPAGGLVTPAGASNVTPILRFATP